MGYSTHYLGSFRIDPPLNAEETAWLRAFRRSHRPLISDPYHVPMNPGVIPVSHPLVSRTGGVIVYSGVARPGGLSHCDWEPTPFGNRLVWVSVEKSNDALFTVQYLIDHFLRPGAHAQQDGRDDFAAFTFNHVVSGIVAAERDDGELFLLEAEDNVLETKVLIEGAGLW